MVSDNMVSGIIRPFCKNTGVSSSFFTSSSHCANETAWELPQRLHILSIRCMTDTISRRPLLSSAVKKRGFSMI